MIRKVIFITACLLTVCGGSWAHDADQVQPNGSKVEDLTTHGEPPMLGIHWTRQMHNAQRTSTSGANMTYHGGKIMPTVVSQSVFWGPSWTDATFVGDKISGLDSWYSGHNASHYAATVNEYTGSNGKIASSTLTHLGHLVDTSTAAGGTITSAILAEVCKAVTSPDPSGNGYYPVYTDVKRGTAGYCAWHSAGTCSGVPVQFAFFFNLDGDSGCDPSDTTTGHSQGLAALANVTAHELSEARSDPTNPGAWYDGTGAENGDKCTWTFNVPSVTFTNGIAWKLQGEWSNAAYTAGTGYANSSGQKGCLSGY